MFLKGFPGQDVAKFAVYAGCGPTNCDAGKAASQKVAQYAG